MKKVRDEAKNKWRSILEHVGGIDPVLLDGKHHKCPRDGEGENRFRFSNRSGTGNYFCACSDGSKDGFDMLQCCRGLGFKDAAKEIEEFLGTESSAVADKAPARKTAARIRQDLNAVKAARCSNDDVVSTYLRSRLLRMPERDVFQVKTHYGLFPIGIDEDQHAMASVLRRPDSTPETIHLTYLTPAGEKAKHERPRILMTPLASVRGCAVRLAAPEDGVLGVGEGIESSLSARALYGFPTWATISANGMASFELPTDIEIRQLHIFADRDSNFVGQAAAYNLARRITQKNRGVEVQVWIGGSFDTSTGSSSDCNDILKEESWG